MGIIRITKNENFGNTPFTVENSYNFNRKRRFDRFPVIVLSIQTNCLIVIQLDLFRSISFVYIVATLDSALFNNLPQPSFS